LKIAMLSVMVLLGLSTSAIAVGLVMRTAPETNTQSYRAPDLAPSVLPALEPAIDASPAIRTPQVDPGVYEVATSPETARATPERHDSVLPPIAQPKQRQPKQRLRSGATSPASLAAPTCDEVACFLGESGACCGTDASEQVHQSDADERADRPYRLGRQQVIGPMKSIAGRVRSCADQNGFEGIATATLVITPEGSVDKVSLDEGSGSFQACVESKVRTLSFPKLQQSFTTKYPFILR
jgi:hypothetical protein